MARFPEFADWLSKFRAWSAYFDRNQSEAQRCLLSGDLGQLSTILQKKVQAICIIVTIDVSFYYSTEFSQLYCILQKKVQGSFLTRRVWPKTIGRFKAGTFWAIQVSFPLVYRKKFRRFVLQKRFRSALLQSTEKKFRRVELVEFGQNYWEV